MINDSSPDNAWEAIKSLAQKDDRSKESIYLGILDNIKQLQVGLDYAKGDWVVVMDCDLQDQPEEIIKHL